MSADDSVLPVRELVERVKDSIAPAAKVSLTDWLSHIGEVLATIVFDSRAQVAMAGFRGAAAAHQIAYSSPQCEVDIQVTPPEAGGGGPVETAWTVRGQVSNAQGEGLRASIAFIDRATRKLAAAMESERDGCFDLALRAGDYDVVVKFGSVFVTLPVLSIT